MTRKFKNKYRVDTTRLRFWDYGWNGAYFVTICTKNREHYFGEIKNGQMHLSEIGRIAHKYWAEIPEHFPFVILDEFVIMPNHVHGIIIIDKMMGMVEAQHIAPLPQPRPTTNQPDAPKNKFGPQSQNLPSIIRGYKSAVKKYATINGIDFAWQPRYYDHIIRNDKSFYRIAEYIRNNPMNWVEDRYSE